MTEDRTDRIHRIVAEYLDDLEHPRRRVAVVSDPEAAAALDAARAAGRRPDVVFQCPDGCTVARLWAAEHRSLLEVTYRPRKRGRRGGYYRDSLALLRPGAHWLAADDAIAGLAASCRHRPSGWPLPDGAALHRLAHTTTPRRVTLTG